MAMRAKAVIQNNGLIIQKANYTCGPVSLLNVLRLKGDGAYSEPELAQICKARPGSGTDNNDLVVAAKQIGLEVVEVRQNATIADIERHLDNAAYVIINYFEAFSQDGHYSVVTDYDEHALYIADCYDGFLRITKKYFPRWWHNSDGSIVGWFMALR